MDTYTLFLLPRWDELGTRLPTIKNDDKINTVTKNNIVLMNTNKSNFKNQVNPCQRTSSLFPEVLLLFPSSLLFLSSCSCSSSSSFAILAAIKDNFSLSFSICPLYT